MTQADEKDGISRSQDTTAQQRVSLSALVGLLAGGVTGVLGAWYLAPLVAWDIAALVYVSWIWSLHWPMNSHQTAQWAAREDPTRTSSEAVLLTASVVSLLAVGLVLVKADPKHGLTGIVQIALGVASVVLSWAVVHTLYALNYARLYYSHPVGGIDFQEENPPAYSDFAYLAFTIGMTFQVSDTELKTKEFRRIALHHALLSYMFGTVIVATTINLIAGLIK